MSRQNLNLLKALGLMALGLGIVLLSLVALVNGAAYVIGEAARRRLG